MKKEDPELEMLKAKTYAIAAAGVALAIVGFLVSMGYLFIALLDMFG